MNKIGNPLQDLTMDAVRQLILNRASELRRPLSDLSLKIEKNHAYLQQFIKRNIPRELPEKVRSKLASELRVPEESLRSDGVMPLSKNPGMSKSEHSGAAKNVIEKDYRPKSLEEIPANQLVGERDLPVFATAQGGKGAIVLSHDPVDWVVRPEPLARVKDGYGVIITEDSMSPEFRSGDTALINPHLPARSGDTCVFRSEQRDGTVLACIKYLRRQSSDTWHVTEWCGPDGEKRDFSMKKTEWQTCHVTVGNYKRR